MIKKIIKGFLVVVICFLVGFSVGRCSSSNNSETSEDIHSKKPIRYEDGEYVSSNIGEISEIDNLEPYDEDGKVGAYYDSQGEGSYYWNEYADFNLLYSSNANPQVYYYTFDFDEDEPIETFYIYVEWDRDYGEIYIEPTESLKTGYYTLSFEVEYYSYRNYDRYFIYNIMLNEGNYTEYEPLDKIYGSNIDLGLFKFATLQSAYFDGDTPDTQTIKPLNYDVINSGFMSKNWDYSVSGVDYGIIADFGPNGYNIKKYSALNILNGSKNDYKAFLGFGQQIYLFFKSDVYSVNGADLTNTLSYIDLEALKQQYGDVLYKIYFVGYGQDYIPGGLSTNNDYTLGFDNGYNSGDTDGFHRGYSSGYDAGELAGYDKGYIEGKAEGFQQSQGAMGIIKSVLSFINLFTSIEILPGIRIIYLVGLVVMVGIFKWILGLFNGR